MNGRHTRRHRPHAVRIIRENGGSRRKTDGFGNLPGTAVGFSACNIRKQSGIADGRVSAHTLNDGAGFAKRYHCASQTRVNALMAPHRIRDTRRSRYISLRRRRSQIGLDMQGMPATDLPVVSSCRRHFACDDGQITFRSPAVPRPNEGRFAIVTKRWRGMRWTQAAQQTNAPFADDKAAWS